MRIKNAGQELLDDISMEWQPIATAPYGVDLELAVMNSTAIHAVVFPCRRALYGWINAKSGAFVDLHPSHWRMWHDDVNPVVVRPAP